MKKKLLWCAGIIALIALIVLGVFRYTKEAIMVLIIGGAYQGKLDYAKDTFGITDADVHTCGSEEIDFSKRFIYRM